MLKTRNEARLANMSYMKLNVDFQQLTIQLISIQPLFWLHDYVYDSIYLGWIVFDDCRQVLEVFESKRNSGSQHS